MAESIKESTHEEAQEQRGNVPLQQEKITFLAIFQGGVASLGGFIFGYIR